ncbi:MAG: hypothetical protein GBAus27B_000191 [Mycoplasmataceae bacterium]|nr:MAG: hypothetical protein GBAus27B_000191 [Mycoplasmataceae bacterium]
MNNSLSLSTCSCHVINSAKTPILVWTRTNKILVKIADQLFIGSARTDKKGEKYWKCRNFLLEKTNTEQEQVNNSPTNQENN